MKVVLITVGIGVGIFALTYGGLKMYEFFGPKYQDVERKIFDNTKSYNEGKEQDLLRYRLQYLNADRDEKEAIASTIRMQFADYDESKLSLVLQSFLQKIKYGER